MNTLWTFGDSALERQTRLRIDAPKHETWTELLAKKLGMNLQDKSWGASSIFYTIYHYRQQCKNFKPGDIVVVGITDLDREWFFEKAPAITTLHRCLSSSQVTEEQKQAISIYFRDFYRPDIDIAAIENFLDVMVYHQNTMDVKIIAFCTNSYTDGLVDIPEQLCGNIGTLWQDISMEELLETSEEWDLVFKDIQHGCKTETRLNHMKECNHKVLCQSVLHSIMTGEPVDFKNGYKKDIMSVEELK
jgi:hypothetical protein